MKIKIISGNDIKVEEEVNNFILNTNTEIIDIKFSSDPEMHNVMIIYK